MAEKTLIAPVPRAHIASARQVAARQDGVVAFGTGAEEPGAMYEFFASKVKAGMNVLIYVSTTGQGEYHGHTFSHAGEFDRVAASERGIEHLRPDSALAGAQGHVPFWIVRNFRMRGENGRMTFEEMGVQPPLHGPRAV